MFRLQECSSFIMYIWVVEVEVEGSMCYYGFMRLAVCLGEGRCLVKVYPSGLLSYFAIAKWLKTCNGYHCIIV
jgi:hypothetical protein